MIPLGSTPCRRRNRRSPARIRFVFPQLHRSSTGRPPAVATTCSSRVVPGPGVWVPGEQVDGGRRINRLQDEGHDHIIPACFALLLVQDPPVSDRPLDPEAPLEDPVVGGPLEEDRDWLGLLLQE